MTTSLKIRTRSRIGLILLSYIAFISLGLPDGLLGVAWPTMRDGFSLPQGAMGMLLAAGSIGYLMSSFFSGQIISRIGVGGVLAASCLATGASLLGYTLTPIWGLVVALGVVAGLGAGAIDAGLNTFVAENYGEGLMQWLHASFGVGITLGPLIMISGLNLTGTWRTGYTVVGAAQVLLAACFALTIPLWKQGRTSDQDQPQRISEYRTPISQTLRRPSAWVSILLFFFYTGAELTLGHWAYTLLTEARGVAPELAGLWAGSYWGMFTVGRVLAGLYAGRLGARWLLRFSLLAALGGVLLLWWNPLAWVSLFGVAVTGFAIAPIFPALVSSTVARVGARHTANTIGMQISAAGLGVAVLPGLAGAVAERTSLEAVPPFLAALFLTLIGLNLLVDFAPTLARE
jgi:fucose permease